MQAGEFFCQSAPTVGDLSTRGGDLTLEACALDSLQFTLGVMRPPLEA